MASRGSSQFCCDMYDFMASCVHCVLNVDVFAMLGLADVATEQR